MSDLICGKAAVGGNYNSTRDTMMDTLVHRCREQGIEDIYGYYYPTAKNGMVKEFYALLGFDKLEEDTEGNTKWCYHINDTYENKNKVIDVEE